MPYVASAIQRRGRLGQSPSQSVQGPPPSIAWANGATAQVPSFVIVNQGSPLWVAGSTVYLWRAPVGADLTNDANFTIAASTVLAQADVQGGYVVLGDPSAGNAVQWQYSGAVHSADQSAVSGKSPQIQGAGVATEVPGASATGGDGTTSLLLWAGLGIAGFFAVRALMNR